MQVMSLTGHPTKARDLWRDVRHAGGVQLYSGIFDTQDRDAATFTLSTAKALAAMARDAPIETLRFLVETRLRLFPHGFEDERTLDRLRKMDLDVGLHGAGVIYRQPLIDSFDLGILNPHIGILPEFRGRSVMEWSLLYGEPTGITTFFIDEGIDTGRRIVLREEIDVPRRVDALEAKQTLFDRDGEMFRRALERLQSEDFSFLENDTQAGHRYYVMSDLFRSAVQGVLDAPESNSRVNGASEQAQPAPERA